MAEAALPGFEASAWFGIFAPSKTPREVVTRLNSELNRALQAHDIRERLIVQGAEPRGSSPEQFDEYVKSEISKWGKVVEASGARVD